MRRRRRLEGLASILRFAAYAAIVYVAIVALFYVAQSRQVYFPLREHSTTPAAYAMPFEDVWFKTEDEVLLHGWLVHADQPQGVVLFFHGNAGNVSHRLDSIRTFRDLGFSVFIIDYRGYGHSEGTPTEAGTYRDAQAAWRYLRDERSIPGRHIVVFGRSLGAAVAAWLSARERPGAVILESAFTSAPDLGAELYPWLPVRWMLRFAYDTREAVRDIHSPLLIVHSTEDRIVPYHHGQALFEAANHPKRFLEIRGGHNDGFLRSRPTYENGLRAFLDENL